MKLLLRSEVPGLGNKGDLVEVADGYARNYLVPKGMAIQATQGIERQGEAMRRARDLKDAHLRANAEEIAKRLVPSVVNVRAKAGTGGKLFGSVSPADIAEAVHAQLGMELDRRCLHTDEPIRETGSHTVHARPHPEVQFQFTVEVVAEGS